MSEKFNLTWDSFMSHGKDLFRQLMETEKFSDVTLISNDQHKFKAHQFILSSCSTVFKTIFDMAHQNSSIYLRGVTHEDLESILQFIYSGETTISLDRIDDFLNVANDLKIKHIGEHLIQSDATEETLKERTEDNKETSIFKGDNNFGENIPAINKDPNKTNIFHCDNCDKKFFTKSGLKIHVQAHHSNNRYLCNHCDYKALQFAHLKIHVQAKHEGIKYPCKHCVFEASQISSLKRHMLRKHTAN